MKMAELMSPPSCHNETFDAFIYGALHCIVFVLPTKVVLSY
jgi:hypothetical protein